MLTETSNPISDTIIKTHIISATKLNRWLIILTMNINLSSIILHWFKVNIILLNLKTFKQMSKLVSLTNVMIGDDKMLTTALCIGWTYTKEQKICLYCYIFKFCCHCTDLFLTPLGSVFKTSSGTRGTKYGCCCWLVPVRWEGISEGW
jgi:hypothetical protein